MAAIAIPEGTKPHAGQGYGSLGVQIIEPLAEAELVERAKAGDMIAFASLYEAYFARIYRYIALRVGNVEEAEDLTADVFIRALENITSFQFQGHPFAAWLYRIAHNRAVDHLRRRRRRALVPLDYAISNTQLWTENRAEVDSTLSELRTALARLSAAQQEVVSRRLIAGFSVAMVAEAMGRSPGAIKALQNSALRKLRQRLRDETA